MEKLSFNRLLELIATTALDSIGETTGTQFKQKQEIIDEIIHKLEEDIDFRRYKINP